MKPEISRDMPNNPLPGVPLVESPLFRRFFSPEGEGSNLYPIARDLHEKGYAVVSDLIPGIGALCDRIIADVQGEVDLAGWQDLRREGQKLGGLRVQDTFDKYESVRRLAAAPEVIDLLTQLYGRKAFPFQTLNFPVGTEQHYHSDAIHFSSYPEKFMCGVWVALEDIGPEQGPLEFFPGSHKLPVYENAHYGYDNQTTEEPPTQVRYHEAWQAIVEETGLQRKYFHARKGDMLIWCANLLHGGSPHFNHEKTRWSQVTHYFFEGCTYYTPMLSDTFMGRIKYRTPINLIDKQQVENTFLGRGLGEVQKSAPAEVRQKDRAPPDFDPQRYLELHADVKAAKVDPAEHYVLYGRKEGRRYK